MSSKYNMLESIFRISIPIQHIPGIVLFLEIPTAMTQVYMRCSDVRTSTCGFWGRALKRPGRSDQSAHGSEFESQFEIPRIQSAQPENPQNLHATKLQVPNINI